MTVSPDLDRRFREAAANDVDVAFDLADTPFGPLLVAATERGVCRIDFDPEPERVVDELARRHGVRVLRAPSRLDVVKRELDQYFAGKRIGFDVQPDVTALPEFQRGVLTELARVPYGRTETYGGLAAQIGRPRAARAVGGALNRNPIPIVLPCHRVVGSTGKLVGYGGGLDRKRVLLELEGALAAE